MPPDLDALPPALTTAQAAEVLNLSADSLERAAKRGDAPVPFYRWGRALRWPREPIRQLLGLGAPNGNGAPLAHDAPPTTDSPTALTRSDRRGQYRTPSDSHLHYLAGLDKLEAARRVIDRILGGAWDGIDPDVTFAIADLAWEAGAAFRRAEVAAAQERSAA